MPHANAPRMLVLVSLVAGACNRVPNGDGKAEEQLERERPQVAQEATSTNTALAFNDAMNSIADARCTQEQRCNNVGAGKRYASPAACHESIKTGFSDDVLPTECPHAVNRRALAACLKDVHDEACGPSLDTLARVPTCRTAALCPSS